MRRMLLLAGSLAVLASVAAVALASGGPTAETKGASLTPQAADAHVPQTGPFAVAAQRQAEQAPDDGDEWHRTVSEIRARQTRRREDRVHTRISRALAGRLDVDPQWMRVALAQTKARMLSRFVDRGVIEASDRIALEGCLNDGRCDPRAIRPIVRKLRHDLSRPDSLADRKEELLHALSRTLDQDEDQIEDALHTQLDVSLSFAERFGAITPRGRQLAVACFDAPAQCDAEALQDVFDRIHGQRER